MTVSIFRLALLGILIGPISTLTQAQPVQVGSGCTPQWQPTFSASAQLDNIAYDGVVFDDGTGPALYVAGSFQFAGPVHARGLAKWTGNRFEEVPNWPGGDVRALAIYDDGTGPALYVGGEFTAITPHGLASNVARFDGSGWSPLGGGVFSVGLCGGVPCPQRVDALLVRQQGSAFELVVGGTFNMAGTAAAQSLAAWNGTAWTTLPSGAGALSGGTSLLVEHDDGAGPELYAAGFLGVARLSTNGWTQVGSGLSQVNSLLVYDAGSGPELYASGNTPLVTADVVRWNGSSWATTSTPASPVSSLGLHDDGTGERLYASGRNPNNQIDTAPVAAWDGTGWQVLNGPLGALGGFPPNVACKAIVSFDDGTGPAVFAMGSFGSAGGVISQSFARYRGDQWTPLSRGVDGEIFTLASYNDGSGSALYTAGVFTSVDTVPAAGMARWNGDSWSPLAGPGTATVHKLEAVEFQGAELLLAMGSYSSIGGVQAERVASFDGSAWSALGTGLSGGSFVLGARAAVVFNDGSGEALYVGGSFDTAGGVSANNIARWDGGLWSPLGSGLSGGTPGSDVVWDLAVFDDGMGPALYASGRFTLAGGQPASGIARWDGSSWSALGSGIEFSLSPPPQGFAMASYDDGSGNALYVGGNFDIAGGTTAYSMARWDGLNWSALDSSFSSLVRDLTVFDDGTGPGLYASGASLFGAGICARWDGTWSVVHPNAQSLFGATALQVFDFGTGPELYMAGSLPSTLAGDANIARFGCENLSVGSAFCDPSVASSTGFPSRALAYGLTAVAANDLRLVANPVPQNTFGFFIVGRQQGFVPGPGGSMGNLCLQGSIGRFNRPEQLQNSGANGFFSLDIDLDAIPGPTGNSVVLAGQTWLFQAWFRDLVGGQLTSNFSAGTQVTFQ
ncbi:MAG: hypothetical protein P1V35_05420 [Planctomycetota bacterium]|nr:hypothetical protein [Planctomycetota bacterium]